MVTIQEAVVTNAAGMVKTLAEARQLLRSAVTRITLGSFTMSARPGNLGTSYYYDDVSETAWNSKGLNNAGFQDLLEWLPVIHEECKQAGKQLAVSLAGFSPEEYGRMAFWTAPSCDIIEINAGCGNVWKDNVQKPIPSYVPELLDVILRQVENDMYMPREVSVKISPVPDDVIPALANVLLAHSCVAEVIGTNTEPNQKPEPDKNGNERLMWRESDEAEWKHTGGMSGAKLRFDSLRVLTCLRPLIPKLRYIQCGGVSKGAHLLRALLLEADGIAVGTAFFEHGASIFSDIYAEAVGA